ncbi:hypothetical protein CASFOL_015389 [Castilleja foliolosa]|uniref:Uncharacterized protein n=1 Tax=Castilleja foliolosa TaxID=1961234 RepID=A0ABD3DHK5_9LAMI
MSLQKFKFLASQCAVAASPTRSPTTSPVVHLRRRKTLRMFLGRGGSGGGRRLPPHYDGGSPDRRGSRRGGNRSPDKRKELSSSVSQKLRDLFVSSPPAISENVREGLLPSIGGSGGGGGGRRIGNRSMRPLTATIRQRLLRRAWRPVLVAIPE